MPRAGPVLTSEVLELPDSLEAVEAHFRAQGWTDGLPIVPPTEARVEAMLAGIDAEPDHVVGKIPPLWAEATVEKVAINAVMAGCGPEAMPVLVAALEAMLEPAFNLYGVQATTHPVAPLADRARAGRGAPRHARGPRGLRAREPGERHARPRGAPVPLEPRRRAARARATWRRRAAPPSTRTRSPSASTRAPGARSTRASGSTPTRRP